METGVNYQAGNTRFSATYFNNRIADLIVLDANFIPQNIGRASVDGIELSYDTVFGGFRVGARLTLQDPVDEATGLLLARRAKEYGSLTVSKTSGPWTLGTEVLGSSARFEKPGEAEGSRMHGYGLVNLTAVYAVDREWSIRARWNNVFDREYELVQGFNTPGSNVFVALQYQPK
jgi:vitamin B12 transporter